VAINPPSIELPSAAPIVFPTVTIEGNIATNVETQAVSPAETGSS
jgi:hypothetical protein